MHVHTPTSSDVIYACHTLSPSPLSLSQLFNTAVTRAKEWLVVCGEPVTLCTVGSNRLCWVELIKKCLRDLDSFEYPNAARFEALLQTKLFTRYILSAGTYTCLSLCFCRGKSSFHFSSSEMEYFTVQKTLCTHVSLV